VARPSETDEGTGLVAIDNLDERREIGCRRGRPVDVPPEIGAHPIEGPDALRAREAQLGARRVHALGRVSPIGPLLADDDALSVGLVNKAQRFGHLGTSAAPAVVADDALDAPQVELVEATLELTLRSVQCSPCSVVLRMVLHASILA